MSDAPRAGTDRWSAWLAAGRFAGQDQAARQSAEDLLAAIRDRVIDGARLHPGEHAVDLGAGAGLLTTAAARAVAPGGTVTAIDISRPALARIDTASSPVPVRRLTADATRLPLADATAELAERAGLTVDMLHTGALTDQLATAAAVDAYLNRSPHPGAPSPLAQVTAVLGPQAARRYQAAWHDAVAAHGPVTFTTPVMYLSCHKTG